MACGVGVIGAGTVGGGVIQTLLSNAGVIRDKSGADVQLRHVAELRQDLLAPFDLHGITISSDAASLVADPDVDVVCELIGGINPARRFITEALNARKHVVTANKMLLAMHGPELNELATRNNVQLRYEAAVAGAIPIIKSIKEGLVANHINAVYGILNGTCNYILSRMTYEGLRFDDVLAQAQELGFAETPPDLDIDGHDTAHKCQILASLCYSTKLRLEDIFVEGIRSITQYDVANAREMGYIIKLLAIIRRVEGEIEARVHPALIPETMLLASVRNEFNAIYVEGDTSGPTLYYGRGAGRLPTASAVVSDIVDIATNCTEPAIAPFAYTHDIAVRNIGLCRGRYYLRFTTEDHVGVLGRICTILGQHGVGIASISQHEEKDDTPAHIVMMTDMTIESSVAAALAEIDPMEFTVEPARLIRAL